MLVLSRRTNERILIASTVEVRVLATHKNKVILGFSAPQDVPIRRGELQSDQTETMEEPAHVQSH